MENLSKRFCTDLGRSLRYGIADIAREFLPFQRRSQANLRPHEFWALKDVSFEIRPGEALAVIGSNGAGKSSLLKLLNGLMKPDEGRISLAGRVGALIELGTGFNPVLTGRENVYLNASVLGMPRRRVDELVDDIIDFSELGDFIDMPLQDYSSGMWVRLAYSVAAHMQPDVLLVDEVLAVGDLTFQRKCIRHLQNYLDGGGSLILVSHNLYLVQSVCPRGIVLERGQITFAGTAVDSVNHYLATKTDTENRAQPHSSVVETRPETAVTIDRFEIEPLEGTEVRSEAPVRVIIHYRAIEDVPLASWGFSFWTPELLVCVGAPGGGWAPPAALRAGSGELTCLLPRMPLAAGTYGARAVIIDWDTRRPLALLGGPNPPAYFQVSSEISEVNNLFTMVNALTKFEVCWG